MVPSCEHVMGKLACLISYVFLLVSDQLVLLEARSDLEDAITAQRARIVMPETKQLGRWLAEYLLVAWNQRLPYFLSSRSCSKIAVVVIKINRFTAITVKLVGK